MVDRIGGPPKEAKLPVPPREEAPLPRRRTSGAADELPVARRRSSGADESPPRRRRSGERSPTRAKARTPQARRPAEPEAPEQEAPPVQPLAQAPRPRRFSLLAHVENQPPSRRNSLCSNSSQPTLLDVAPQRRSGTLHPNLAAKKCSGFFIDCVQRFGHRSLFRPPDGDQQLYATHGEALLGEVRSHDWQGFDDAVDIINSEMLLSCLHNDLVRFWKYGGGYAETPSFHEHVSRLVKLKREIRCVHYEVGEFIFRHKLLHCRPHHTDTPEDRHGRQQVFWAQFHEGSRRREANSALMPLKEKGKPRPKHPWDQVEITINPYHAAMAAAAERRASFMSEKRALQNGRRPSVQRVSLVGGEIPPMPPMDSSRRTSIPGSRAESPVRFIRTPSGNPRAPTTMRIDLEWKNRSMRSNCSAGQWDWSQGSLHVRSNSPKPRTVAPVHWSTNLFGLNDDEMRDCIEAIDGEARATDDEDEQDETFPTRPPTRDTIIQRSGLHKKVMSLPNLHGGLRPGTSGSSAPPRTPPMQLPNTSRSIAGRDEELPPVKTFMAPWQSLNPTPVLKCEDSPTKRYLRACQRDSSLPRPLPLVMGHSTKLNACGQALSDTDLLAVVVTMDGIGVEEVTLDGNSLLTERSLMKLVQALARHPNAGSLRRLSLKGCFHAGQAVMQSVVSLISAENGVHNLRVLDLTDVPIGVRSRMPFAKAVRDHWALKTLHLCNTGLGNSMDPKVCIGDIFGSQSVEVLDLGWNCFAPEVLSHIGRRHIEMQRVLKLNLSNCASAPRAGQESPMVYFLEHLSRDRRLRYLDISLNQIDFRSALVLEDALQNVRNLTELNISHNPLGIIGMRCLLRLLSRNSSGLEHFFCDECTKGTSRNDDDGQVFFRAANPGGRYTLELERPSHRALLRMLYKTCERLSMEPSSAFSNVVYSLPPWKHAPKDNFGVWVVPMAGRLTATFNVDKAVQEHLADVPDSDFSLYVQRHHELMRCTPGFMKIIPLLGEWKSIDGRVLDQFAMLDALSKDFLLRVAHLEQLCQSRAAVVEIISRLFASVEGGPSTRYLTLMISRNMADFYKIFKEVRVFLSNNLQNPNGNYKLDLGKHMEYATAEQLLLLDRWETGVSIRRNRLDMSQKGNYSVLRNERYQHRPMDVRAISEWIMPEHDLLEFDYSSGRRPPAGAAALDDVTYSNLMITLQQAECTIWEQISALRMVSHMMYLTSVQLRSFFNLFRDEEVHADVVVIFFARIVDLQNEKVFRVRVESGELIAVLRKRLGSLVLFPFIQPEQTRFNWDLAQSDQRLAANILLQYSKAEGFYNLRNPSFIHPDGRVDPLPQGIPRSWEALEKMPSGGIFGVTYMCAAQNRSFQVRKQVFQQFIENGANMDETKVMWWASLAEVPQEVLDFLEFLIAHYDNMTDAFIAIDGGDGNGVISLREFEVGYKSMGCMKLQGPNENKKVEGIFRFLDVRGGGQVGLDDFLVFQQLYEEIKLSIREFVGYCTRCFGDNLEDTWKFLDASGDGNIDQEEWTTACDHIGYCGPTIPIFRYLDADDEGTISLDEFMHLEKYVPNSPK